MTIIKKAGVITLCVASFLSYNTDATEHNHASCIKKAIFYTGGAVAAGMIVTSLYNLFRSRTNNELCDMAYTLSSRTSEQISTTLLRYESELNLYSELEMGNPADVEKRLTSNIQKNGGLVLPFLLFKFGLDNATTSIEKTIQEICTLQNRLDKRLTHLQKKQKSKKTYRNERDETIEEFRTAKEQLKQQHVAVKALYANLFRLAHMVTGLREFKDEMILYRFSEWSICLEKFKNEFDENTPYHCSYNCSYCSQKEDPMVYCACGEDDCLECDGDEYRW